MAAITNGNTALQKLLSTPTGQKLYQECQKKGVKINFAENNGDNTMGQYDPKTNTITVENANLEQMVEVLAHEMLHASTKENGNSKNEELQAFLIGEQVATEAGVNANPHGKDFYSQHVNKAYANLQQDNGIAAAIGNLGINTDGIGQVNVNGVNYQNGNYQNVGNANPFEYANAANNDLTNQNNPLLQQGNPMAMMMQMMMQFFMMMMQMFAQMGQNNNNTNTNLNNQLLQNQGLNLTA